MTDLTIAQLAFVAAACVFNLLLIGASVFLILPERLERPLLALRGAMLPAGRANASASRKFVV